MARSWYLRLRQSPATSWALGLWLVFVAINPGRNEVTDAGNRLEVARAIWMEGRVSVAAPPKTPGDWFPTGNGRLVSFYGIGQSLLMIPFDVAGYVAVKTAQIAPDKAEAVRWMPIGLGLLPLLGLLWWHLLRRVLQEVAFSDPWAGGVAALTITGTIALPYIISPQEECLVGCLLAAALLGALRWHRTGSPSAALLAGAAAGACLVVRVNSALALSTIAVMLLASAHPGTWRRQRWWTGFMLAGVLAGIGAASVAAYNYVRFDSLVETGYGRADRLGKWALDRRSPAIAAALLFGPGKGWFVLSPVLVLALFGLPALLRRLPAFAVAMPLSFLGSVLLSSAMHNICDGPMSWGTRYQVHLVTLFVLPLAFGLQTLVAYRPGRWIAAAFVLLSLCTQFAAVFTTVHLEYAQNVAEAPERYDPRETNYGLVTSARNGQLPRRFRNIAQWLVARLQPRPVSPSEATSPIRAGREQPLQFLRTQFVPDFWGPVIAKRLHGVAGTAVLLLWTAFLVPGLVLLTLASTTTLRNRRDKPPGLSRWSGTPSV